MLKAGAIGELTLSPQTVGPWAHHYTPMLGHWTGSTVERRQHAPLPTGDIGYVDDQGWVRVVDRQKMVILRGGANVYPAEVEHVLRSAPGVGDAVVFGIPDERLGERVAALIEQEAKTAERQGPSVQELHAHCADQLAGYKVPAAWAVVSALPRNPMGKIQRSDLEAILAANQPAQTSGAPRGFPS